MLYTAHYYVVFGIYCLLDETDGKWILWEWPEYASVCLTNVMIFNTNFTLLTVIKRIAQNVGSYT